MCTEECTLGVIAYNHCSVFGAVADAIACGDATFIHFLYAKLSFTGFAACSRSFPQLNAMRIGPFLAPQINSISLPNNCSEKLKPTA